MTAENTNSPLKAFFEPKTLTELGILGSILTINVNYEHTSFEKTGFSALARKLPIIKSLTPFKSDDVAMDIDLSCVVLNQSHQVLDKIWYGKVRGLNDSIRHVGGLCGASNFEESLAPQESISVRLHQLPDEAQRLIFVISSYHKHPLSHATKGTSTLIHQDGSVIYDFSLDTIQNHEWGVVAWVIERVGNDFKLSAPQKSLGESFDPTNLNDELEKLVVSV